MDPELDRREEARADEEAALAAHLRTRTLASFLAEAMAAGDRITARCGTHEVGGTLVAVVGDHALLTDGTRRVVLHLAGPLTVGRRPSSHGGTRGDRSHDSFRARLATLGLLGDPVEVVHPDGTERGPVAAVAIDHLLVADGHGDLAIPLGRIAWVAS